MCGQTAPVEENLTAANMVLWNRLCYCCRPSGSVRLAPVRYWHNGEAGGVVGNAGHVTTGELHWILVWRKANSNTQWNFWDAFILVRSCYRVGTKPRPSEEIWRLGFDISVVRFFVFLVVVCSLVALFIQLFVLHSFIWTLYRVGLKHLDGCRYGTTEIRGRFQVRD